MSKKTKERIMLIGIASFIFIVFEIFIGFTGAFIEERTTSDLLRKSHVVESDIDKILLSIYTVSDAYASFLTDNQDATKEDTENFLKHLFSHEEIYLRNIAYIEDTTIKYNYPYEGNESSIGVDLALVSGQRDYVLEVKETKELLFHGPVELVQGGQAFILLTPIVVDDVYIGHISSVIDKDEFLSLINHEVESNDISIELLDSNNNKFIASGLVFTGTRVTTPIDHDFVNWTMVVYDNHLMDYQIYMVFAFRTIAVLLIVLFVQYYNRHNKHLLDMEYQATHDFLTGSFNRKKFITDFHEGLFYGKLVAFMDVNKFKVLNDTLGHQFGDWVLIEFCKCLEKLEFFRVYRNSGDEFLIVSNHPMSEEGLLEYTNHFNYSFYNSVLGQNLDISLSVGVIENLFDDINFETMLMYLDYAMYDAKKKGIPYTLVDQELMNQYSLQKEQETLLIDDIKNNRFITYYQPIIDIKNNNIYSIEVLSRWKYKDEIISAGRFIDIVKKIKYIERVDQNLFDNLQKDYLIIKERCSIDSVHFSINLSAELLKTFESNHHLFDDYINSIEIPKEHVIFEISEDINLGIISNETIEYIKQKGFRLVIDDFGSGVSKLSDVLSGKLLAIKTDKSMLPVDKKDVKKLQGFKTIIKAINSTGSMVCAEGIETKEQLHIVKDSGCSLMQGYLFSKPLSLDELIEYMNSFDMSRYI